jgi:hypothetical protein
MARRAALGAVAALLTFAAGARAESSSEAQADALFNEGKHLVDAGQLTEGCTKFAQSQQLSPGVGVALHLGSCYEKLGKTASAWQEYRAAEKLARDHGDAKRADVARTHAEALEGKLSRLTLQVPEKAAGSGGEVRVDGAPMPPAAWNVPLAIDPGDHEIAFAMPGQAPRTVTAHVDAAMGVALVRFDDPTPAAAAAPPPPPAAITPAAPEPVAQSNGWGARRWITYGLVGVGLAGIGIGAALLAANSQSPSTSTSGCSTPPPDSGDTTGAIIAFAAGGVALGTALVLVFTTHPSPPKETSVVLTPAPLPGGGGAFLRARF